MEIIHQHPIQANDKARSALLEMLYQRCITELREQHRILPCPTEVRGR